MNKSFLNKSILITGGAQGLGRLFVEHFIKGAAKRIDVWDIDTRGLETLKSYSQVRATVVDLTSINEIEKASLDIIQENGAPDIIINNAGIVTGKSLSESSIKDIERTFQVNALAPIYITRAFLPEIMKRGSGHFVTMASAGGLVGTPKLVDYTASKFAAVGFTESLRVELKKLGHKNIHTTLVCPFFINTGMFAGVKTRFPLLLPILDPEYVVQKTIKAIEKKHTRLIMPRFVYLALPLRILPSFIFDSLMSFFGINHTMDDFRGR